MLKFSSSWSFSYISINESNLLCLLVSINWSNLALVQLSVISFTTFLVSTLLLLVPETTTNSGSKNKDNTNHDEGSWTTTTTRTSSSKGIFVCFFWNFNLFKCCFLSCIIRCFCPFIIIFLPCFFEVIKFFSFFITNRVISETSLNNFKSEFVSFQFLFSSFKSLFFSFIIFCSIWFLLSFFNCCLIFSDLFFTFSFCFFKKWYVFSSCFSVCKWQDNLRKSWINWISWYIFN